VTGGVVAMGVVIVMIFSHCVIFPTPSLRASRSNPSSGASCGGGGVSGGSGLPRAMPSQ